MTPSRAIRRLRRVIPALLAFSAWGGPSLADGVPGKFDYYVLALSWSPSFCATAGRANKSPQCNGPRRYAFVLHGLWPQYEKGWPKECRLARKPWVPGRLITAMLDIMPARGLVIHQYKKHGVCSGLDPEKYFKTARRAFEAIKIPARYLQPQKPVIVSPREIESDFLKTNNNLKSDMIAIACGRDKRLREVRICFTRDLELRSCGVNETQAKLCRLDKIVMPPVRGR